MSSEIASGLGCVVEASLSNESQNEIIEGRDHFSSVANGHAGGIFLQGDIAAVM
jgi:hypothetical protein